MQSKYRDVKGCVTGLGLVVALGAFIGASTVVVDDLAGFRPNVERFIRSRQAPAQTTDTTPQQPIASAVRP